MKLKIIVISIILLSVMIFVVGCSQIMENIGLVSPTDEEQLTPEKGGPPDGLVKVLIGFKQKPGPAQQAMVKGVGGQIKYTYHIVDAIAALIPEKAIDALQKNPNVRYVELDGIVYALDELGDSWGVERIGAGVVHESGNMGAGVKVAILDTGIDSSHSDLNVVGGKDFVYGKSYDDKNGHGTHVAGIVAALDNGSGVIGVAPGAVLYAVKVLGNGGMGWLSDIIAGLAWSVSEGMQVANMSLGGAYSETLKIACQTAYDAGLLLVAAAGNGGSVIYPAAYGTVIAVSATNSADELAGFSSTGSEVELAAPGVDIYSTYKNGGYATKSGTSMASPHVAGTAALVWANPDNLNWTNVDVRTQLKNTAEDIRLSPTEQGSGLVDAAEAVGVSGEEPEEPTTGTMYVESITFSAKKAGKNLFLYTTVKVLLGNNITVVDGAKVEMTLTNGGGPWYFVGDTGSDGTVKFTLLKAQPGNYTSTVTGVSHPDPDYVWDGTTIIKTCTLNEDGTVN